MPSQSGNKKARVFVSGKHFKANKTIAYPSGSPFVCFFPRKVASRQPTNIRLGFETIAGDKRTSFLFPSVLNKGEGKVLNQDS
jgi:hypothetical protein